MELVNSRGQYQHPTPEAIEAAGLDDLGRELWATVDRCNSDVTAATEAVKRASEKAEATTETLARARERLGRMRPPVSAVDAARAFILSTR